MKTSGNTAYANAFLEEGIGVDPVPRILGQRLEKGIKTNHSRTAAERLCQVVEQNEELVKTGHFIFPSVATSDLITVIKATTWAKNLTIPPHRASILDHIENVIRVPKKCQKIGWENSNISPETSSGALKNIMTVQMFFWAILQTADENWEEIRDGNIAPKIMGSRMKNSECCFTLYEKGGALIFDAMCINHKTSRTAVPIIWVR